MPWSTPAFRGVLVVALAVLAIAPSASAATFTVGTISDGVDATPGDGACDTGAGTCTLRAAVQEANALAGPDAINLPAGTYEFAISGRGENAAATGDLDVTDTLAIAGPRARTTTVSAKGLDRVFDVRSGQLSLSGVTVTRGSAVGAGDDSGGGARVGLGATMQLDGVQMVSNTASGDGDALNNAGTLNVRASSIAGPSFPNGSAVASAGSMAISNTTLKEQEVDVLGGATTIVNSTLVGGGSQALPALDISGGSVTLTNSILKSSTGPVCTGANPASGGHNIVSDGSCALAGPGDQGLTDPGLQQENTAGDTHFFPLWAYGTSFDPNPGTAGCSFDLCPRLSRAVDAADAAACPATDQLGVARPQGAGCDIGAIEVPQVDLSLSASSDPATVAAGQPFTLTWTITNLGPASVENLLMTLKLEGVTVVSQNLVPPDRDCTTFAGSMCDLQTSLAGGASLSRTLTLVANSATPAQRTLSGLIQRDGSTSWYPYEPNQANNSASTTITVLAPPPTPGPQGASLKPGRCANPLAGATAKADVLRGTSMGDLVAGLAGNDRITGASGDDCLKGGAGNDILSGGAGSDRLSGDAGNDKLTGGAGRDYIDGGGGADVVNAADHKKDTVKCGKGRDRATVDKVDVVRGCEKVKRKR